MKIFAGYDGGGTKTAVVLSDETGRLLGTGVGGPSNHLYCGKETAGKSVREATLRAFESAGLSPIRLEAAYMASAAILLHHGQSHLPFFSTCIDAKRLICECDLYPIWYGAVGDAPAVISIAGTGAITYVLSPGGFTRVSGYGPLLGDEGSGYDLALRALRTACRMADGRVKMDEAFMKTMLDHYDADGPLMLLRLLNQGDIRSKVASCAKTVCELYAKDNPTAQALVAESADEIALAILTAANASECPKPLPAVLSGSLVKPGRPLFSLVKERLLTPNSPIASVCAAKVHPAVAAAALALRSEGLEASAMRLMADAKEVFL